MRFLIVDDEATARNVLKEQVKLAVPNSEIIEADNGAVAIYRFFQKKPDIVLLDLLMPVVDGETFLDVVEACHQRGMTVEPRVVVITSFDDAEKLVELQGRPSVEVVIPKPITQGTIERLKSML